MGDERWVSPPEIWLSATVAALVGLAAMLAVLAGVPELTSVVAGRVPVAANTGLGFTLLASALFLVGRAEPRTHRIGMVGAGLALLIGAVTALQFITGREVGVDQWLFPAPPGASEMSPQTATAFVLLGGAVLVSRTPVGPTVCRVAGAVVGVIALINVLDVLYGAQSPTILGGFTQMALPTAVAFFGLGFGTLALAPSGTLLEQIRQPGPGGTLARSLAAAALVIPIVVGLLRLAGERAGWYDSAYGVALNTAATIVLFLVAVRFTARAVERAERHRREAERAAHSAREQAREEAEAASAAKSQFLSRMSHELRTPLNSVLGFAQLLEADDLTPDQREGAVYIRRAGQHLLDLINEILDISRIEQGRLTISVEPVMVQECLEEVASFIAPLAAARGITVSLADVADCEPAVLADRQRLRQVLLNLLTNAVKYNRDDGEIRVGCQPAEDGWVRIGVTDTGPGIPVMSQSRLFEPFDRLGAEATPVEGSGMGLALSRALMGAMGGQIGVDSEVGRGSTFWIALPRAVQAVVPEAVEASSPGVSAASAQRLALYIEDNPANLRLVERIVSRMPNLRLQTAIQGRIGIELAREHHPDLVLLDVHLPDMDGKAVLVALRADPRTVDVPVVILSADASEQQREGLLDAGADAYLTKPIDVDELIATINRVATDRPDTGEADAR